MNNVNLKEEARRLIDKLPDNFTWDDLLDEIYVRKTVETVLKDSQQGKMTAAKKTSRRDSILDVIEQIRRRHPHRSLEQIDSQLREERNSWES